MNSNEINDLTFKSDRLLDTPIAILFDQVSPRLHVANGHGQEEFASTRLLPHRFDGALAEDRELHLDHRPFHAEQQSVVRRGRIVHAVFVEYVVPTRPQNSSGVCQSRPLRARRDASSHHAYSAGKTLDFSPANSDLRTIVRSAWACHRKAHPQLN